MKPVFVIGHKNPDIDSVAAAIGYKIFKQSTASGVYVAAIAGEITAESKFVLDRFAFPEPTLLRSVAATAEDLLDDEERPFVTADMSVTELSNLMRQHKLKTIPVLDDTRRFLGLITIGDVAMIFLENLGDGRNIEQSSSILKSILSQRVSDLMQTRDLVLFEKDESVDEVKKNMLATRYRNYPVVDDNNRFLGFVSRYNLLAMRRKQVILVDHNEKKQAVDGIEEADILEIIDHHRVGDLQTIAPIYFHNEPVGSTSTLVAEKFLMSKIFMNKELAGLLYSGILTDTMVFKSPTTTEKDRIIAKELQDISGLDPLSWGKEIFSHSYHVVQDDPADLIISGSKEYLSGNIVFAVSQIESIEIKRFSENKKNLLQTMNSICQMRSYDFMCLMVTDIFEEATLLLLAGEKKSLAAQAFGQFDDENSIYLKNVLSRKKQVIPVIYEALRKNNQL